MLKKYNDLLLHYLTRVDKLILKIDRLLPLISDKDKVEEYQNLKSELEDKRYVRGLEYVETFRLLK